MQEKKRIPLKRLHRLRNARKQAAETDDLTPMMKAIKAVHSVTSTGSTQPEDLERQRAAQELFGRLVTPNLLINTTPITVNDVSAEWVRMNQGHDRRHVVLYCHGGGYTCGQLGYARVLASKLALSTGCDVLSFEYRLAPEAPYPSAIDDALRVWDYLMYMGIGARDVIVAGDSAGGNLAGTGPCRKGPGPQPAACPGADEPLDRYDDAGGILSEMCRAGPHADPRLY